MTTPYMEIGYRNRSLIGDFINPIAIAPNTNQSDALCQYYKRMLTFDTVQLVRVILTWFVFILSSCGNVFVLYCLCTRSRRSHVHIITLHLTLADLAFTFLSMPMDATWNVTMAWLGGDGLCRICQMLKQFGMYISSFMVVVIALDRAFSILSPMSTVAQQRSRTRILLLSAWTMSAVSAIPPAILFSVSSKVFCQDRPAFTQCVDFKLVSRDILTSYRFFTMIMSFIIPFIFALVSYSLVLCEITNMQKRDQQMMGRRASSNSANIARARKKTLILTSLVTLSFVVLWGPYYAIGIYMWFDGMKAKLIPKEITMWLFLMMYFHPAVHPIIYGVFMKDVRKKFQFLMNKILSCISCGRISSHSITAINDATKCCSRSNKEQLQFKVIKRPQEFRANSTPIVSSTRTSRSGTSEHSLLNTDPGPDINRNRAKFLFHGRKFLDIPRSDVAAKLVQNGEAAS